MAQQKKKGSGGWFMESLRHSLASKGVKTGSKNAQKPKLPRAPMPSPKDAKLDGRKPTGKEILFSEGDDGFGQMWTDDETQEQLRLVGEVVDPSSDETTGLIFEGENGKRVVRDVDEIREPSSDIDEPRS